MSLRCATAIAAAIVSALALLSAFADEPRLVYVKKSTKQDTIVATLEASGLPMLRGKWYYIGPFDNADERAQVTAYPPEKEIKLSATYPGKGGVTATWRELPGFRVGRWVDLKRFQDNHFACLYLLHEFDAPRARVLDIALSSDNNPMALWLNGQPVAIETGRGADRNQAKLPLRAGKNQLLVKVSSLADDWYFFIRPRYAPDLEAEFRKRLEQDFPDPFAPPSASVVGAESAYYRIATIPVPRDIVLEVGGLGFRPDGKLVASTRRGDVWLISNPDDPAHVRFQRFATGLHEPLGVLVEDNKTVYVVQRPELTRLVDTDGDGVADRYETVCDQWGVSGDYHEFAYGPVRDKEGNFYVTLNVGFGGGHQSKASWRGWCVKITPKGELIPYAVGLRSPNGLAFSPDGDLFYTDNQGEWVASNKLHHVRPGEFYGHPAGLRWLKDSPFAGKFPEEPPSGMHYDGQAGEHGVNGMPPVTPPAVWFPYGRMGQSASEPVWDTTGGKFGPFAGQLFVGDQCKSNILRVDLQKVNGRYQGACFPFRSGFECGVNRLTFAPDGSLYVGMTNRGWGSVGGKPYGLQRLVYTAKVPFEVRSMKLTPHGFDLTFTRPVDPVTAGRTASYSLQSFTYNYWSTYGSPEVNHRPEPVRAVTVAPDGLHVSLAVDGFRKGRVYELHLDGVRASGGAPLLHAEAYYTLNELP